MKRFCIITVLLALLVFVLNACSKNNPSGPTPPAATRTSTAIIIPSFTPPTSTETSTITPTATVSPTFTVTMTETPFIIDDFNDNDLYNNINPPANQWDSFVNTPDAASNSYTVFSFGLASGFQSYGLQVQSLSHADNYDGLGNYFTYYGLTTTVAFTPTTGINFTLYRHLIFQIKTYIWDVASATYSYKYKVKLFDDTGRYVEQEITGLTVDNQSVNNHVSLDVSLFTVPAGASYAASDVQANVMAIRWEYSMVSTIAQDSCESYMNLDDILLEK